MVDHVLRWRNAAAALGLGLLALGLGPPHAAAQVVPPPSETAPPPSVGDPPPDDTGGDDAGAVAEEEAATRETAQETTRSSTLRTANTVARRVGSVLSTGRIYRLNGVTTPSASVRATGRQIAAIGPQMAQGGGDGGAGGSIAAWVSSDVTLLENERAARAFDGRLVTPIVGVDYASPDGWVAGVALGYEGLDLDTGFNDGTLESDGVSIVPYAGVQLGRHLTLDGGAGYVGVDYARSRPTASGPVTGRFDGDRAIAFANLTGTAPAEWIGTDAIILTGKTGFRYSREEQSAFTENGTRFSGGTLELGQVSAGLGVAHVRSLGGQSQLQLFARTAFNYDAIQESDAPAAAQAEASDDRSDVSLALGAAVWISPALRADLEYGRIAGREDINEQRVTFGMSFTF